MKDLINNIFSNVVATYILQILTIIGGFIISILNPSLKPYLITFAIVAVCSIVLYNIHKFGTARFKWTHIHSVDTRSFTLFPDFQGVDLEHFKTIGLNGFEGKVSGDIFSGDVTIEKITLRANNAQLRATLKFENKAEEFFEGKNYINKEPDHPAEVNYDILFDNNKPTAVDIQVSMKYDIKKTSPEYYIDVSRPMLKLVVELKVKNGVKIRNVRKQIIAKYGEKTLVFSKNLKGTPCKEDPTITKYKFITINPRILHRYAIVWDWISVSDPETISS